ncbi:hypothetical protein ANCCEY_04888 [Ancylostoma ceylanicum]|uniref:Uncharacterized protein n=1 Tax=Ancylostoma ceylanicum TaxID=53326 RepID=A0A0D6M839_9BILA|nr:hypothetical protein ANCCEY_04888 [Ancylostoma ceylanicum]
MGAYVHTEASVTLLITGHSSDNVYKHQLASLFVESYDEIIEGTQAHLFAFTNGVSLPVAKREHHDLLEIWKDLDMPTNVTTLVLTTLGTDEMSLDHLSILQRFMSTHKALIVIEIGRPVIQTRALLDKSAPCQRGGHAVILSPNTVYFCNKATPTMLPSLEFIGLHKITQPELEPGWEQPQALFLMPKIFLEEDVEEIVDQIMEEIVEEGVISGPKKQREFTELSEEEKKKFCKYRKSCYESGVKPVIDDDWIFYPSHWWPFKKEAEEEVHEAEEEEAKPYDEEEDLTLQKLQCKYRVSCYHERGIPFTEKPKEEPKMVLASKKKVQPGKKLTLKELAAKTLLELEEAAERAAKRPILKVIETKLSKKEEELNEKLNCKYRKSCYETGQKPVIEDTWRLPIPIKIFSTESADTVSKQINYSELEELEKKLYCKYRKSCYETGVKPEIEPEIFIRTLADLTTIHEQVETRKLTLQEKCKYRKSCYETGIVPEINPKLEAVIQKEVSPVIPTNVQDLKMLCKYRKSCYAEVHDSATVDTIKFIRKRRQIEKEVKRRKARRAKLHRRLRGEMQLGHWRARSSKRAGIAQKAAEAEEESVVKATQVPPAAKPPKPKAKARKSKQPQKDVTPLVEEVVERVAAEVLEEEPQLKKQRKTKKTKVEEQKDIQKPAAKKATPPPKTAAEPKEEAKTKQATKPKEPTKPKEAAKPKEEPPPKQEVKPEPTKQPKKKKEAAQPPPKEAEKKVAEKEGEDKPAEEPKTEKRFEKAKKAMKKMVEEMHHQRDIQEQKEYCKYRKSCYATGKKPKIAQPSVSSLVSTLGEQLEKAIEEFEEEAAVLEEARSEAEKKLHCKYRKSCYETGILPEIVAPHKHEEQGIVFKAGVSKQLQCKYRKSCYRETGITAASDEVADTEEKRKPTDQRAKTADELKDIKKDNATAAKATKEVRTPGELRKPVPAGTGAEECKAGKACYTSAEPKAMKEDHAGSMARIGLERFRKSGKCSPYYYSCREVLGLPPKEKAPIGPNGKRLCRKKKL